MADPAKVIAPDDTQKQFTRMQNTFALDLIALYELELPEVMAMIKKAGDEGWTFDMLESELGKLTGFEQ